MTRAKGKASKPAPGRACPASDGGASAVSSHSPSVFGLVSTHHANAIGCRVERVVIDFAPMAEVSKACSKIFSEVDRDDPLQRRAARDAWIVKSSLMMTALPFDDPRLGLDGLLCSLETVSDSVPSIRNAVGDLGRLVRSLAEGKINRKREAVLAMLDEAEGSLATAAILANICGSPTPGWPITLVAATDLGSPAVELLRMRRQTRNASFSRVIIPGNPWFAPRALLFDLVYGGRSSDITVVTYRAERSELPAPSRMPQDSWFPPTGQRVQPPPEAREFHDATKLDTWASESFWSLIHAEHADVVPISAKDVTVDARFVLFADGSGAFLPADGRVVEISDLFEPGASFDAAEDRLPRAAVRELEEGDLVMLRLSGSGDYLADLADSLMERAGEAGLRSKALKWKDELHEVIKKHGEGVVAVRIRSLGVRLADPQYLWSWAGDAVMSPHDRQTFQGLIAAIWQLEGREALDEASAYADEWWTDMERVKTYHHKAGAAIRAALLTRVRSLVADRRLIASVESIELPGVEAGRMGLLRVSAVDAKSMRVPMSRLFQLVKVREN
jgi:hypothetical protein